MYNEFVSDNEKVKIHLFNIRERMYELIISKMKDLKKISRDKKIKQILEKLQEDYKEI